jgi:hypothetical protein
MQHCYINFRKRLAEAARGSPNCHKTLSLQLFGQRCPIQTCRWYSNDRVSWSEVTNNDLELASKTSKKWELYRIDDHGREYRVGELWDNEADAEEACTQWNARGHKQGYFVRLISQDKDTTKSYKREFVSRADPK